MGFFDFLGQKPTASSASASQPASDAKPVEGTPVKQSAPQPVAPKPVSAQPAPSKPDAPQPEQPKQPQMWRFLLTMSSQDPKKLDAFFAEFIRHCIYKWHHVQGRVGIHTDNRKIRIELKAMPEDIDLLLKWVKIDHFGVHATLVEKYKISTMPYTGLFQKRTGAWL